MVRAAAGGDQRPTHRRGNTGSHLTVSELRSWTLLVVAVSFWSNIVRAYPHGGSFGLDTIAQSLMNEGGFNVAAWALIAAWSGGAVRREAASRRQIVATLAIGVVCLVPSRQATICALVALGAMFPLSRETPYGRQIAVLLFGLAAGMTWTSTYLFPLHAAVANLDVRVIKAVLDLAGQTASAQGNTVGEVQEGFGIEVLAFCASSFPLASVGLAFVVTTVYCGRLPRVADVPWLGAACLASVALTEVRLSLMAIGQSSYAWFHDGYGVTMYTLAALALAVLFPLLAVRQPRPRVEPVR
jgi:hypothetical protein